MARPLRIEFAGALYHITARGNAREAIFRDAAVRELFLDALGQVVTRFAWLCHAYCLMDNTVNGFLDPRLHVGMMSAKKFCGEGFCVWTARRSRDIHGRPPVGIPCSWCRRVMARWVSAVQRVFDVIR